MNMLLKCRIQNVAIVCSFVLGILLTLSFTNIEKQCETSQHTNSQYSLKRIKPGIYDLIILIISSPTHGDRRQGIRETWLQFEDKIQYDAEINNFKLKYYFVIGSVDLNADTIIHLSTEQSVNNDLLFLNLKDEYSALTSKILNTFVWLNEQHHNQNFNYNFMLKCDDDSFVRLDILAKEIVSMRTDGKNKNLYWGYFNGNAKIKTQGKWKELEWIYCDRYLPYALGGGYILSRNLVSYIAHNSQYLKLLKSEDVSIGLWLAPVSNIERKHDIRFDTEWKSRGCKNTYLITHKHSIEEMRNLYKNIEKTGQMCVNEFSNRPSYFYNWNVLPSQCCQNQTL